MKPSTNLLPDGVMFNAYPDSCGGTLRAITELLSPGGPLDGAFSLFYVLPSLYNSDLDRGFSIVDYEINGDIATEKDLARLRESGLGLKLDFVLNHISVQSPQFRDILANGADSDYFDFFIDWNEFWKGNGEPGPDGCIVPNEEHREKLFMRKPGLPVLEVPLPDGTSRFFWNTFYQEVTVVPPSRVDLQAALRLPDDHAEAVVAAIAAQARDGGPITEIDLGEHNQYRSEVVSHVQHHCTNYLGQMDLNARSEDVWDYYQESLKRMSDYGARIIRLDAFAYLHKEVGSSNFFNEPGTWEYLARLKKIADDYGLILLPEIHSRHRERTHQKLADNGYPFYDFFFPGLVIDAIETGSNRHLLDWIREVVAEGYVTVNMLGCHDGIPLLDVQGLLDDQSIDDLIAIILDRGGMVKDLYGPDGEKISYYQVNATFYSALGNNDAKLLLARAIQMFMPGIPEIWYLDLFAGTNDHKAAQEGGHKEINRTNLSISEIEAKLQKPVVQAQLELLKFRNAFPAFGFDSRLAIADSAERQLELAWTKDEHTASLTADLTTYEFEISYSSGDEMGKLSL